MDIITSLSRSDLQAMPREAEAALPPKYSNAPVPIPVALVPTPTQSFREHRKMLKALVQPGIPRSATTAAAGPSPIPIPLPLPLPVGARVLMWKQDPQIGEIGIRKADLGRLP